MASDPWNGLPENPERDGWHWLRSRIGGNVRVDQWLKEGLWMHCSINSTVRLSYEYLGPCLTPADLAARVEAERVACAKAVSVVFDRYHKKSDPISQTMAAGVVMAEASIRALGPTPAYNAAIQAAYKQGWHDREGDFLSGAARIGIDDAAIQAAREDGMGAALLAVSQLTQPENGETGDLRFMRDAWNGVVEEAKAAIRAAKDQPV